MSGLVNCNHLSLKHVAIDRQTKTNVQVQFPRVDTFSNHIIEYRGVGIYPGNSDNRIRIPVTPNLNQKVETPVETIFSREIVDIPSNHWTKGFNVPTRQGITAACLMRSTVES